MRLISIHALLAESDEMPIYGTGDYEHFYPRSPCGERRYTPRSRRRFPDISIHALLAESDLRQRRAQSVKDISIHALLAESDKITYQREINQKNFYPRSPCGERQPIEIGPNLINDFYPRSPCGERLRATILEEVILYFYPRSPCGERQRAENHANSQQEFLSTLSLRRATSMAAVC